MSKKNKPDDPLKRLEKFLDGLTDFDKANFVALLDLASADKVIDKMPDGEYKEMAKLCLKIKRKSTK